MRQSTTILWDLDGTLLDSFGIFQEVLSDVLPAFRREVPPLDILRLNYHGSLHDSISNALGGVPKDEMDKIERAFLESQNGYYEIVDHHIYPDALDFAKRAAAKNINQILVTNRNHVGRLNASPRSIVERSELSGLISKIICGDDSEHRKPNPEVLGPMIEAGLLVPSETLVIGDQFVDAQFAKNIGAKALLVCRQGDELVHMDKLGSNWQNNVTIANSLSEVSI